MDKLEAPDEKHLYFLRLLLQAHKPVAYIHLGVYIKCNRAY